MNVEDPKNATGEPWKPPVPAPITSAQVVRIRSFRLQVVTVRLDRRIAK